MSTTALASTQAAVTGAAVASAKHPPRDVRSGAYMLVGGRDAARGGGGQVLEILGGSVEMVLEDAPGLAGRRFPGVAVHLAACGPCEDFQGLLAAAGATR